MTNLIPCWLCGSEAASLTFTAIADGRVSRRIICSNDDCLRHPIDHDIQTVEAWNARGPALEQEA